MVKTSTPEPHASRCAVRGAGLTHAMAREPTSFEISFRDQLGTLSSAVELDVFVERALTARAAATAGAKRTDGPHSGRSEGGAADHEMRLESRLDQNHPHVRACRQHLGDVRAKSLFPLMVRTGISKESGEVSRLPIGTVLHVLEIDETQLPERLCGYIAALPPGGAGASGAGAAVGAATPSMARADAPRSSTAGGGHGGGGPGAAATEAPLPVAAKGWVTLKEGTTWTVDAALRLDAQRREEHAKQWARQMRHDQMVEIQRRVDGMSAGVGMNTISKEGASPYEDELRMARDPTGFSFGGVYPGTLHAKGAVHEFHRVRYAVSVAGTYLLHVRLRKEAAPVPGSPFLLTVDPGPPYAASTMLSVTSRAEVGQWWHTAFQARDKVGNTVTVGGTDVVCTCKQTGVETQVIDKHDGSYELHAMTTKPGVYELAATIDGFPLRGAPALLEFCSTIPAWKKSELSGAGLVSCKIDEPTVVSIAIFDRYGNRCSPPPSVCSACAFGMSLLHENGSHGVSKKTPLSDHPLHTDFSYTWATEAGGVCFELSYVPHEGGLANLQLWYAPPDGERVALHDGPFKVDVFVTEVATKTVQVMPGDYAISKRVFNEAQERWGKCDLDAFASEATALCRRFYIPGSDSIDLGTAEGSDSLRMSWYRRERVWAHPPVDLLPRLVEVLERPNCTAEVLVCAPDHHEEKSDIVSEQRPPMWYKRLLKICDDRVRYPAGELRKIAPDAPDAVVRWPVCVFRVPPKLRFGQRRNAVVQVRWRDIWGAYSKQVAVDEESTPTDEPEHEDAAGNLHPYEMDELCPFTSKPMLQRKQMRGLVEAADWTGLGSRRTARESHRSNYEPHFG